MHIFLDLQGIQTRGSRNRGIGRYSRDLIGAIIREIDQTSDIYLGWNHELDDPISQLTIDTGGSQQRNIISAPYGSLRRGEFAFDLHDLNQEVNHRLFSNALARSRCGHVLFTSLMEADEQNFFLPKHLNFNPLAASYSIVYDIIPLLFKEKYLKTDALLARYYNHLSVKLGADIIFTISETTRNDLIRHVNLDPSRIVTIGTGIDTSQFTSSRPPRSDILKDLGLHRPFLLFMGGSEFRKNLAGFVNAILALPPARRHTTQALILGKVEPSVLADIGRHATDAGLPQDGLIFREFVPHEDLLQLYKSCALTVVPSLYEGFGLPVLEAMACGAAVVASANSSMSEIIRDERFLFDPRDAAETASCVEAVLSNPGWVKDFKLRYPEILARYTWRSVAQRTIATIKDMEAIRTETKSRVRGQGAPPKDLAFAFLDVPESAWIEDVKGFAGTNSVRLYFRTAHRDIETLPIPISRLDAILKQFESATPIFCFARTTEQLLDYARSYPLFNAVAILDSRTLRELSGRHQDWPTISNFYEIWHKDAGGVKVIKEQNFGFPQSGQSSARHFKDLRACISDLLERYVPASSYHLGNDLKRLITLDGNRSRHIKDLLQQASIAPFGWRSLCSKEENRDP